VAPEHEARRAYGARELRCHLVEVVEVQVAVAAGPHESPTARSHCCATMCVSSAYEAMLNGTPRKMSALRWYSWHDSRPPAT